MNLFRWVKGLGLIPQVMVCRILIENPRPRRILPSDGSRVPLWCELSPTVKMKIEKCGPVVSVVETCLDVFLIASM